MRLIIAGALSIALAASAPTPAKASVFTDDLSRCIVTHSSAEDQTLLVQWIFAAMAASPKVAGMAKVTPTERDALSDRASALFVRLLASDCHRETVAALKADGGSAISASFEVLGKVAMGGLIGEAPVASQMARLGNPAAVKAIAGLATEAGIPLTK